MESNGSSRSGGTATYDLGVLFVHGIGTQTRGSTLTAFGTPIVEWLDCAARRVDGHLHAGPAVISDADHEPARCALTFARGADERHWLLAECWWADSFPVAQFRDVAAWSLLIVPWTIGTHFVKRLRRKGRRTFLSRANALGAFVAGLICSPFLLLAIGVLLILGRIPWAPLRETVAVIQLSIAGSLGDSFMLVSRPIEAAAIRSRLRRDLLWLQSKCRRVAVVAHSQGAAVAAQVLSGSVSGNPMLLTFGSGLRKLEELGAARRHRGVLNGALLTVVSLLIGAVTVVLTAPVVETAMQGKASPASVGTLVVLALTSLLIGIAGIQDFLNAYEPTRLTNLTVSLIAHTFKWRDIYSSADPVPNGRLRDRRSSVPTTTHVVNLGSVLRDHTSYWDNADEFVPLVVSRLVSFDQCWQFFARDKGDAVAFARAQRRARVALWQAINWTTGVSLASLLFRFRVQWLSVAAWMSRRAVGWLAALVGIERTKAPPPDLLVWQQSLGWMLAALGVAYLSRQLWTLSNRRAMRDVQCGRFRVRPAVDVFVSLFAQCLIIAVAWFGWTSAAFTAAGVPALAMVFSIGWAQFRIPTPRTNAGVIPDEPLSGSLTVFQSLWRLSKAAVVLVGAAGLYLDLALPAREYLLHLSVVSQWMGTSLLIGGGVLVAVVAVQAALGILSPANQT